MSEDKASNDGIGGHLIIKPLTYEVSECCDRAWDQGFLYGEIFSSHHWARIFKQLRRFNFTYDARYRTQVNELLKELDAAIREAEAVDPELIEIAKEARAMKANKELLKAQDDK